MRNNNELFIERTKSKYGYKYIYTKINFINVN